LLIAILVMFMYTLLGKLKKNFLFLFVLVVSFVLKFLRSCLFSSLQY